MTIKEIGLIGCGVGAVVALSAIANAADKSHPIATAHVLCIELSPDKGSAFVGKGPCSHSGDSGPLGGGGGGDVCYRTLRADQAACARLPLKSEARATCEGKAVGKYTQCEFNQAWNNAGLNN